MNKIKCELFNDHFQNYKRYSIPKAQLVIADIPYNLGNNAYASNPDWYKGGKLQTASLKRQAKHSLIPTIILELLNLCTFAQKC